MEAMQIFSYNNAPVTFKNENGVVFISATEMAQQFGKRPVDFLRTQSAQNFINELSEVRNCTSAELVSIRKGGLNDGTWMQEDVAIEFARWLSPSFAIWANDRIKELLRHGVTTTNQMMEQMLTNPDAMINALTALKVEREEKQRLLNQNVLQQREIATIAPKAEYFDTVLQSTETYVITRIAQELGVSAVAMNRKLAEMRVQRKVDGQWMLYRQYVGNGYTKSHTTTYTKSNGETGTNTQTVWTEKGRQFIHSLFPQSKI
ncbi:MAG: phage antirepressor KilAC domain-containing protein [Paludibacter sp.]|nr:phage antirepressor KilAC domain-containing protein [Paludibacter sp.]